VTLPRIVFGLTSLLISICLLSGSASGQELECGVTVNYEAVSTTHKDLLSNFADDVRNYLNNYPWGQDPDISVSCAMSIFVQSVIGENRYSAQVAIVSQREHDGSQRVSPMVRLKDDAWEFTYVQNRPLNHNPSEYNDLTSFLDFYAYLILGYDYDSYEALSGTGWFQRAADVANLARSSGQKGWQNTTSSFSRTQLIDELLSPGIAPLRKAGYTYHFSGLDSLMDSPRVAYAKVVESLESIGAMRAKVDPRSIALRAFFDAKFQEVAELFATYPDASIYTRLGQIDPTHISTYEEYRKKRE
jgi:hypothetical protein